MRNPPVFVSTPSGTASGGDTSAVVGGLFVAGWFAGCDIENSVSLNRGSSGVVPPHRILQKDDARLVNLVPRQLQFRLPRGRRQKRSAAAEKHRRDRDLYRVNKPRVEQASEERAAAEEPDVF